MFDLVYPPKLHRKWQTSCFESLEALEWRWWCAVTCFGVRIGLRADDPELFETLRSLLPADARPYHGAVVDHWFSAVRGGPVEGSRIRKLHLLYGNHDRLVRGREPEVVVSRFPSEVRYIVAALAPRYVFVHAGAVAWKGRAVIFPGRTFSGKSTLAAEMVRLGAHLFSDEFAVLDARGRVHPFSRPLSLRNSASGQQVDTPVEALGGRVAGRALPVGLVVMSEFDEKARWRPRTLTAGQGALALLAHTVTARQAPERSIARVSAVVADAPVVRSKRGDAAEVAPKILRMLERRAGL